MAFLVFEKFADYSSRNFTIWNRTYVRPLRIFKNKGAALIYKNKAIEKYRNSAAYRNSRESYQDAIARFAIKKLKVYK